MYRHLAESIKENDNKIFISDIDKQKYDNHENLYRKKEDTYDRNEMNSKLRNELETSIVTLSGERQISINNRHTKSSINLLEIHGRTIQSETDLADIRSVGEPNGDGTYSIPIKMTGRNLFNNFDTSNFPHPISTNSEGWLEFPNNSTGEHIKIFKQIIRVKPNTKYTVTIKCKGNGNVKQGPDGFVYLYSEKPKPEQIEYERVEAIFASSMTENGEITRTFTTGSDTKYIRIRVDNNGQIDTSFYAFTYYKDIMFNEGGYLPFEPYTEEIVNINIPTQLERIGETRDKLCVRPDGSAYIEKRIRTFDLDGTETYAIWDQFTNDAFFSFLLNTHITYKGDVPIYPTPAFDPVNTVISNKFTYLSEGDVIGQDSRADLAICSRNAQPNYIGFRVHKDTIPNMSFPPQYDDHDIEQIKQFFRTNNVFVKAPMTYEGSKTIELGNIQTIISPNIEVYNIEIDTEIEPSDFKISIPVSTGGEVSFQTKTLEKIESDITRMSKMSLEATVRGEMESNKINVSNSDSSYISDIEIEGKTVRNLLNNQWFNPILFKVTEIHDHLDYTDDFRVCKIMPVKPNTTYTVFCSVLKNTLTGKQFFRIVDAYQPGQYIGSTGGVVIPNGFTGDFVKAFKTGSEINENTLHKMYLRVPNEDENKGEIEICKVMILEGDWTNKPVGYFKTLGTVGGNGNRLNLVSADTRKNLINVQNHKLAPVAQTTQLFHVSIPKGTDTLYCKLLLDDGTEYNGGNISVRFVSQNGSLVSRYLTGTGGKFTFNKGYLDTVTSVNMYHNNNFVDTNITLILSLTPITDISAANNIVRDSVNIDFSKYGMYKGLQSLPNGVKDRIYKRKGKYYIEQRVGFKIINNSTPNITISNPDTVNIEGLETVSFQFPLEGLKYGYEPNDYKGLCLYSNLFETQRTAHHLNITDDYEWIRSYSTTSTNVGIRIYKSRLSEPTIAAFLEWLKTNPIELAYELATPIIHELEEDLDLQTFGNSTVISHAVDGLYPKISYNINNNVSNTVNLIMEDVDELEDKFDNKLLSMLDTYYSADTSYYSLMSAYSTTRKLNNTDNDLFNLLKLVIESEKYDTKKIEKQIDFFTITDRITFDMADELFNMIYANEIEEDNSIDNEIL